MVRSLTPQYRHRGGATQGILIILGVLGALTTTAVFVGPRYLNADPEPPSLPEVTAAVHPRHQAFIDDLAVLVTRCIGVLAIHPRGSTPFEEIVLWLTDDDPMGTRGRPDEAELAVLSHSSVMQMITIYRLEGPREGAVGSLSSVDAPSFCDAWRADPDVVPLVLQRGIEDLRVDRVGQPQEEWGAWGAHGGFQRLLITLTWPDDAPDGADTASVLVDTVVFSDTAAGPST